MSSEPAIRVAGLGKCYQIYAQPRDRLKQFVLPRLRRALGLASVDYFREYWALKEVDFEIMKGETVAIIGKNGSGKSTLLQMICGTLNTTNGSIQTRGRIAALLELGAGFNPEFTGRENVYLNGSVLGLSKSEIDRRFDEIATFADIGEFIEQPVKTYSSGMFVRLAFAVQACVDPEILVVDEALSVGDIGFQYKCFKRMESLRDRGVTILMVTHSTGSVLEFADRCIVLDRGRVVEDTVDVLAAILRYEKGMLQSRLEDSTHLGPRDPDKRVTIDELRAIQATTRNVDLGEKRFGSARAIIETVVVTRAGGAGPSGETQPVFKSGDEVAFRFRLLAAQMLSNVVLGVSLSKPQGVDIWGDNNLHAGQPLVLPIGESVVEYRVRLPVAAGEYLVHCGLACFNGEHREELDQRRPMTSLRFLSSREQVGVVHAPIQVFVAPSETHARRDTDPTTSAAEIAA